MRHLLGAQTRPSWGWVAPIPPPMELSRNADIWSPLCPDQYQIRLASATTRTISRPVATLPARSSIGRLRRRRFSLARERRQRRYRAAVTTNSRRQPRTTSADVGGDWPDGIVVTWQVSAAGSSKWPVNRRMRPAGKLAGVRPDVGFQYAASVARPAPAETLGVVSKTPGRQNHTGSMRGPTSQSMIGLLTFASKVSDEPPKQVSRADGSRARTEARSGGGLRHLDDNAAVVCGLDNASSDAPERGVAGKVGRALAAGVAVHAASATKIPRSTRFIPVGPGAEAQSERRR